MSTQRDLHLPVLVGVDGTSHASRALEWAAAESSLRGNPLVVLCAYSLDYPAARSAGPGEPPASQPLSALRAAAEHTCAQAVAQVLLKHPTLAVTGVAAPGDPGSTLVDESTRAGLVVVGARGLGRVRGMLLGSVSSYLVPRSHSPVVVVRETPSRSLDDLRVVVGVDGSAYSAPALRFAFESADRQGAGLTVVHTWDLDVDATAAALTWAVDWTQAEVQERSVLAEAVAGFAEEFPTVDVRRHAVRSHHPVGELVRQSENARLLVLGTRGRGSVKGAILGSVSQGVLHDAHCPVAVVPTPHEPSAERPGTQRGVSVGAG